MVKILVIYIPSKYWDLLTLSQGPEDEDPQDQCCGNQKPCKKNVIKKLTLLIPHTGTEVTYIRKLKPNCNKYSKSVIQNFQVQFKYTH
jgi:hypothetical protein